MAALQQHLVRFLPLFVFMVKITFCCPEVELYVIRSMASPNLVLDGSDVSQVRVQNFTGTSPQLWRFERGYRAGLYYVANNQTEKVLAFAQRDLPDLVTSQRKESLDQQWSLSLTGRITNAANRQNIDIWKANYTAGNRLIGANDYGAQAQVFGLEVASSRNNIDWCKILLR